jgi:predicted nucleic acid-binding protein
VTVFLDTVGLLALWDQSDQWHPLAHQCFGRLLASRADLVTSNSILLQCGNAAARRPYRSAVTRLRKEMEQASRLMAANENDWQVAWAAYELGAAGSAGTVDQLSFAIMRRLGISHAFTNDAHFRAEGFEALF